MSEEKEKKITGGDLLIKALICENVRYMFGVPGGQFLTMYDAIYNWGREHGIDTILMRHEQAAAHAADAWGRVTGTPGVCFGTVGPGATHLVPGIGAAWSDNIPVVAIVPQTNRQYTDMGILQGDLDQITMFKPITKCQRHVVSTDQIPQAVQKVFREAVTGRPRPVLLEIAEEALIGQIDDISLPECSLTRFSGRVGGDPKLINDAVDAFINAKKPLLIAGGGIHMSDASTELTELAEYLSVPVGTSIMGVGAIQSEKCILGASLVSSAVMKAVNEADCILILGSKLSFTLGFGDKRFWNPDATIIQVDIDPSIIAKNRTVNIGIVGDCKLVLQQILQGVKSKVTSEKPISEWLNSLKAIRQAAKDAIEKKTAKEKSPILPQKIIKDIYEFMDDDAVVIIDGGDIAVFAMEQIDFYKPRPSRSTLNAVGMGHLGTAVAYAVGAKLAKPDKQVIAICGDGSFLINVQDLDTLIRYNLPVIFCIANNSAWGMIKSGQKLFMKKRFIDVDIPGTNYTEIAKGFGCHAERVDNSNEIKTALQRAVDSKKPAVIEIITDWKIPAGTELMGSMGIL
ncbi:MAG: thiamine pyrophosphate-binding protein [Candidatus Lokiarchaeota archaeon]|nr:thiamine pyrophosphate-binding protein [Candidatus Lokiarchaeota archaeon]